MKKKNLALIVMATLLAVAATFTGIKWMQRDDAKRQTFYEQRAIQVGVTKAKEECLASSFSADICDTLSGKASTVSDATSETYWIVHVTSSDGKSYKASMFVKRLNNDLNNLVATDYMANNATQH